MSFEVPYDMIGGEETLDKLVKAFYPKVYAHPDLAPLFQDDMTEIMRKQKMFLTQFLGGPALYSMEFGAPAMRARHMPFEITPKRAEAWLACMKEAMDDIQLTSQIRDEFYNRLQHVAAIMINTPEQ